MNPLLVNCKKQHFPLEIVNFQVHANTRKKTKGH